MSTIYTQDADNGSSGGNVNAAAHKARWRKVILEKVGKGYDVHVWKRRAAFYQGRRFDSPCPHGIIDLLIQEQALTPLKPTVDRQGQVYGLGQMPTLSMYTFVDDDLDDEDEDMESEAYAMDDGAEDVDDLGDDTREENERDTDEDLF